ncbi:MAG: endonuclease III [Deltaproteobacteria bacterium]|jgi:endonuclease-3|nr:endonuclease III [Deltaproteobacteria bacterium]
MARTRVSRTSQLPRPTVPDGAAGRAVAVLAGIKAKYPQTGNHLHAENPWQLLVATVLAAQCTDARVNAITPALFRRWPDPAALAAATQPELEEAIRSTGFFRNKAKNLLGAAAAMLRDHNGQVPASMAALIRLPGVARKTANCVLWGGFGRNEGLAVDTHVKRIAFRLGLTGESDPDAVERDLMRLFPQSEWGGVNYRLVLFGREVCDARKPLCASCELRHICPRCGLR